MKNKTNKLINATNTCKLNTALCFILSILFFTEVFAELKTQEEAIIVVEKEHYIIYRTNRLWPDWTDDYFVLFDTRFAKTDYVGIASCNACSEVSLIPGTDEVFVIEGRHRAVAASKGHMITLENGGTTKKYWLNYRINFTPPRHPDFVSPELAKYFNNPDLIPRYIPFGMMVVHPDKTKYLYELTDPRFDLNSPITKLQESNLVEKTDFWGIDYKLKKPNDTSVSTRPNPQKVFEPYFLSEFSWLNLEEKNLPKTLTDLLSITTNELKRLGAILRIKKDENVEEYLSILKKWIIERELVKDWELFLRNSIFLQMELAGASELGESSHLIKLLIEKGNQKVMKRLLEYNFHNISEEDLLNLALKADNVLLRGLGLQSFKLPLSQEIKEVLAVLIERGDSVAINHLIENTFSQSTSEDIKDLIKLTIEKGDQSVLIRLAGAYFSQQHTQSMTDLIKMMIEKGNQEVFEALSKYTFSEPHSQSAKHLILFQSMKRECNDLLDKK